MAFQASSALKNVCDKGHNWFTTQANKFRTEICGYNQIQPKLLPKGLSMFKQEHCIKFDENEDRDNFLRGCARALSIDVSDNKTIENIMQIDEEVQICKQTGLCDKRGSLKENERNIKHQCKSEALLTLPNIELRVMTPNRYKRSRKCDKIIVKSSDAETLKILPGVLLTYKEEFIKIRHADDEENNDFKKNKSGQESNERNVFKFRERSDSLKSIDI